MSAFETINVPGRLLERTAARVADVPQQERSRAGTVLAVVSEYPHPLHWVTKPEMGVAFKAKTLLALVTYCYLNRVYSSMDIEAAMRQDKIFRFLCGHEFPSWHQLRQFRRYNRQSIEDCLKEALRRTRRAELEPAVSRGVEAQLPNESELLEEARRRVETAIIMDTCTLEE